MRDGKGNDPGQADPLLFLGFYSDAWRTALERGGRGGGWVSGGWWKTDRGVMGKMTLIPGTWRQVAEEEESWTATSNRCNCG